MLTRRRAATLAVAVVGTLVAAGSATGAFGAVGRVLADPATARAAAPAAIPANQPAAAVKSTKPPVPDPPWTSQLPPHTVYPIWTDTSQCYYQGVRISCHDPNGYGWFNPLDNCYWLAESPQPKAGAAVWLGLSVADGNIYDVRCVAGLDAQLKPLLGTVGVQFSSKRPPGTMGTDPSDATGAIIAAAASVDITGGILAPSMGLQPRSAGTAQAAQTADRDNSTAGLVGLPTWYWSTTNLLTIGPVNLSVALPIAVVQASLLGQRLEWDTGDHGNVVVCAKTGTPYTTALAGTTPACGYTYTRPGTYAVTARSVWFLGVAVPLLATGTVLVVRSATPRYIKIDELQVVTE